MKKQAALDWTVKEVCRLLEAFGEVGWVFSVVYDKKITDYANVATLHGQRRFTLTLGPAFLEDTKGGRQNTVLHEVLHVLQRGMWDLIRYALRHSSLTPEEHRIFDACFEEQVERHTDMLATVFAGKI